MIYYDIKSKDNKQWWKKLEIFVNQRMSAGYESYRTNTNIISDDQENDIIEYEVSRTLHAVEHKYVFKETFFEGKDYKIICDYNRTISHLLSEGAYIERNNKKLYIDSFEQAIEWLLTEARKGQMIQRYKGLGEMNPDQLWETTMDPVERRMLQVNILDAVEADKLFTTLMGDDVEPRRDFIESNALNTINLDV